MKLYIGDNVECDLFADDAKLSKHAKGQLFPLRWISV